MHFIVKVFPEIIIKSVPVRKRFIYQLRDNLRNLLRPVDRAVKVQSDWEKIEVVAPDADESVVAQTAEVLAHTPGIANFALIAEYPMGDLDYIFQKVLPHWRDQLSGKTFCVRVKRHGNHPFSSTDVERFVGGELLDKTNAKCVDLHNPDITVQLEIKWERLFVITQKTQGLGGYPLGAQDSVLSLISGGFDSTVSTYLCIKRGLRAHYCFFNLGGRAHELGVKEVAYFLWNKYGASHKVKFVTVPFEAVLAEILDKIENPYMGVVLKRMMLRAAEKVAESLDITALVTGESVAQVASQTLVNLNVIDRAIDMLVLRPLATMDKGEIIDLARKIGTETFAAHMPEYCGVISVSPTTRAKLAKVIEEEAKFDNLLLENALAHRKHQTIDTVMNDLDDDLTVIAVSCVQAGQTVIDIRHPDEAIAQPLRMEGVTILQLPFYALSKQFNVLDPQQQYFLYCQKGVMSQLHAANLKDEGHSNVGVYRPEPESACGVR